MQIAVRVTPTYSCRRLLRLTDAKINVGPWSGCSGHEAIKADVEDPTRQRQPHKYIPRGRSGEDKYGAKENEMLQQQLTACTADIIRCQNVEELETAHEKLTKELIAPWEGARTRKPNRFRRGWNRQLDKLATERTKAYIVAKRSGREVDWQKHKELHGEIRVQIRQERRKQRDLVEKVAQEETEEEGIEKAITIAKQFSGKDKRNQLKNIRRRDFTARMETPSCHGHIPQRGKFGVTEEFRRQIQKAIRKAPNVKAEGDDELFNKRLKRYPVEARQALAALLQNAVTLHTSGEH